MALAEGLRSISSVQHSQCQIWIVCLKHCQKHWTLVEKVLHKCRGTALGTLSRSFSCSAFNNFCSPPVVYLWLGRIRESFRVITSHRCSCTSHLCGLSAHLHWQECDLCFTERSCLLCSVPGFPAVIWHFEPVLKLILSGILTQMKVAKVCGSPVRWEREYKCFPAEVNIILNSYVFLKQIYLNDKVHVIKKYLFLC